MNKPHLIHRMTHRVTASLKSILKPACCVGLPLLLAQSPLQALYLPEQPGRGYPIASLTPAELAAWKESIASAERLAVAAKNHLGFAQTSAQQQNVGGVRQGCEGARTAALAAVASANRANALALSIAATTSAQNATAWANQAANLLRIFTTPPPPLPRPRRILLPQSEIDNPANLKSKIGVFQTTADCCGTKTYGFGSGSVIGRFAVVTCAHVLYHPPFGFYSNVAFRVDPLNPSSANRKIYTVAVKSGYRYAVNNNKYAQTGDADLGMAVVSYNAPFAAVFTNNGALRTTLFDPNFPSKTGRQGVAVPYRARGYTRGTASVYYKEQNMTSADLDQLAENFDFNLLYYNPQITSASSTLGPGCSGGPLVRERHQSGFLWGEYSYLEVVGVYIGAYRSYDLQYPTYKVFNLTDLYFIDYFSGEGPGRDFYHPDGFDRRDY